MLEPDDARAAADAGADGVVVSNHGGRQLDSVASSIAKLPGVVAAVGDRLEVLVDGGIRSGIDVLKALALGARGALIGRPWIWAMAGGGRAGALRPARHASTWSCGSPWRSQASGASTKSLRNYSTRATP